MQRGPPPRTWWVQMPPCPLRHRPCPPNSLWNWGSMCLCSFTHRHIPDTTPAPSYQMPVMFTSPRVSMRWVLFYGWENTGSERFSTMPTVTQLVSDTAGIWTHQGRGTTFLHSCQAAPAFLGSVFSMTYPYMCLRIFFFPKLLNTIKIFYIHANSFLGFV